MKPQNTPQKPLYMFGWMRKCRLISNQIIHLMLCSFTADIHFATLSHLVWTTIFGYLLSFFLHVIHSLRKRLLLFSVPLPNRTLCLTSVKFTLFLFVGCVLFWYLPLCWIFLWNVFMYVNIEQLGLMIMYIYFGIIAVVIQPLCLNARLRLN